MNHAVLATGYSAEFIKIKNSWGTGWGESGFMRMKRTTDGCGPFGLYMYGLNSYPIMDTTPTPSPPPSPTPSGSADCKANSHCADLGLTGQCCPTKDDVVPDCCS